MAQKNSEEEEKPYRLPLLDVLDLVLRHRRRSRRHGWYPHQQRYFRQNSHWQQGHGVLIRLGLVSVELRCKGRRYEASPPPLSTFLVELGSFQKMARLSQAIPRGRLDLVHSFRGSKNLRSYAKHDKIWHLVLCHEEVDGHVHIGFAGATCSTRLRKSNRGVPAIQYTKTHFIFPIESFGKQITQSHVTERLCDTG